MKLGDVCDSVSVTFDKTKQQVVLINTSDVLEGEVTNHILVDNKGLKGQFKKTFQKNDILYSEIRPKNRRFAYIDFDSDNYVASTKLMVIRANNRVLPQYLYQILIIPDFYHISKDRSCKFSSFLVGFLPTPQKEASCEYPSYQDHQSIVIQKDC